MKQHQPTDKENIRRAKEYATLVAKTGMTYKELSAELDVGYECISNRANNKQRVTEEAMLAIRMVLVDIEHTPKEDPSLEDLF